MAGGENPKAADSFGIRVVWSRIWTTKVGAALIGIAGAYLPLVYTGTYTEGMVGGRGWLAIALTFFGGWRRQFILAGALFLGRNGRLGASGRGRGRVGPEPAAPRVPYVATLLVMIFAFRWARVPEFLGRNYDRESRVV